MAFLATSRWQGIAFAVLWTASMWWMAPPRSVPQGALLIGCGVVAGALFGWAMGRFLAWYVPLLRRKE